MNKPKPAAAIITGLCVLAFGALYFFMGIFPSRTAWSPGRVITLTGEPFRFGVAIFVTLVLGAASLIWGIMKLKK